MQDPAGVGTGYSNRPDPTLTGRRNDGRNGVNNQRFVVLFFFGDICLSRF